MTQLPILPILLPLLGAAVSLFVEHRRIGTVVQRSVGARSTPNACVRLCGPAPLPQRLSANRPALSFRR